MSTTCWALAVLDLLDTKLSLICFELTSHSENGRKTCPSSSTAAANLKRLKKVVVASIKRTTTPK